MRTPRWPRRQLWAVGLLNPQRVTTALFAILVGTSLSSRSFGSGPSPLPKGLVLPTVQASEEKKLAGQLRVAYFGQDVPAIDSLFPAFDPDSYAVITQIFDSLVHADLDGKLIPGLATKWQRLSPTLWEFSLRPNVTFHNGEPFDAQAVKFTFDFIQDPKNQAGNAWIFNTVKKVLVDPQDPLKVRFETTVPDGMFLNRFLMFGSICPPKYISQVGIQKFHEHPIGTGPFQFQSWTRGKEIVLSANPKYWRPEVPHLKEVRFLVIPEKDWLQSLQLGKVDFVPNLSGNLTKNLAREHNGSINVVKRLVLSSYWVMVRNQGALADLRVRQALNMSVQREALVKYADFGNARPMASLGKKGEFGADESLQPYPFDLKKAKALLLEAGHSGDLKLKVLAADVSANVAKIIKANFKELGVEVDLQVVSRSELVNRVVGYKIKTGKVPDYDMVVVLVDNPTYNLAFHAGLFLNSASPWALLNSPEFDSRFRQAVETESEALHLQRLQELDRYIHDQALMIFTTQRIITAAVRSNFLIPKFDLDGHLDYELLSTARVKP